MGNMGRIPLRWARLENFFKRERERLMCISLEVGNISRLLLGWAKFVRISLVMGKSLQNFFRCG